MTDSHYWSDRWSKGETGWDAGKATSPLVRFIDGLSNRELRVLVPGAGSGWEVEYLWRRGFREVQALDVVAQAWDVFHERVPDFPRQQWHTADFFNLEGSFDLIIEQTFFCALDPALRSNYATHMHRLLRPNGRLCGLFFEFPLTQEGPPFGGDRHAYTDLFSDCFNIDVMESCTDSIAPRMGRELWVEMTAR
jgi:methyl halide transferase